MVGILRRQCSLKMLFKSIFVLPSFATLVFCLLELPPDLKEYADVLHDICIKRTGITEDDHMAYDIINNPHDEKIQCYIKCLMQEATWMTQDGVIRYEWIEENIHPGIRDLILPAVKKCTNIEEGANLCEKASNFNHCLYKADNENWLLV